MFLLRFGNARFNVAHVDSRGINSHASQFSRTELRYVTLRCVVSRPRESDDEDDDDGGGGDVITIA